MKIGSFLTASQKSKQLFHINDNGENQVWYNASQGFDNREEGRCKHKDNTRCVIEEETEALGVKPLRRPPSGKQSSRKYSWDTWTAIDPPSLIYPVHLSPPSFLLQRGCAEPFFSSSFPDSATRP